METIVVTRHAAFVELVRERGLVGPEVRVFDHIDDPDVIMGKRVIGVLPLHLARFAAEVVVVELTMGPEDRGRDLPIERLRQIAGPTSAYQVRSLVRSDLDAPPPRGSVPEGTLLFEIEGLLGVMGWDLYYSTCDQARADTRARYDAVRVLVEGAAQLLEDAGHRGIAAELLAAFPPRPGPEGPDTVVGPIYESLGPDTEVG